MAKINRVNGNVQAFASQALGTERTLFGAQTQANDLTSQFTPQFLRGWGIVSPADQPSMEDFNGAMYTHGQMIAYLHQAGVPEYNSAQEYFQGSVTQIGGIIYRSLVNANIGNSPSTSTASWASEAAGKLIGSRVISTGSLYVPTPGTRILRVRAIGGGGGSGGSAATGASTLSVSGSGASGSWAEGWFSASQIVAPFMCSIGNGGAAGAVAGSGSAGGTTTFGSLMSCPGGGGGGAGVVAPTNGSAAVGGAAPGGVSTGGSVSNSDGMQGLPGFAILATALAGAGGGSQFGAGGRQAALATSGTGWGSGASGSRSLLSSAGSPGAPGSQGVIIVEEYS